MKKGDRVVTVRSILGAAPGAVPVGTAGTVDCQHRAASLFFVDFDNGRSYWCRSEELRYCWPSLFRRDK